MPDVNVYDAFKELIQRLLGGDEEVAELAATDPEGLLAAYGITEASLDGVDFRQAVDECYHDYELSEGSKQALQSYVAGGAPPSHYEVKEPPAHSDGYQATDQAVQHLQYVTYATYEDNETVTREIVNKQFTVDQSDNRVFTIDNSTDVGVDVGRNFDGDITVAPTNAAGDGAVANTGDENVIGTGAGDVLAATGGSEINAATGDGAIQGERIESVNTGEFQGIQAGDAVNGGSVGENTGVVAGEGVDNPVVGDENRTANLDVSTAAGAGGNASGTGGDGEGGLDDSRVDFFETDTRDAAVDGSGTGGDGTGGTGGDGGSGDVGPINLNFGDGDQSTTNVDGDVRNSAVSAEGDAENTFNEGERVFPLATPSPNEEAAGELREATEVELEPEAAAQESSAVEAGINGGSAEVEELSETAPVEELSEAAAEDDASLGV